MEQNRKGLAASNNAVDKDLIGGYNRDVAGKGGGEDRGICQ